MNPERYFMPMMRANPTMYMNPMMRSNYLNFRGGSLFGRLGSNIKNFNWKGIFSGVNKTLNVVNQTIPLVRQAKPMYDNVKSIMKLTRVFKNETRSNNYSKNIYKNRNYNNNILNKQNYEKKESEKYTTGSLNMPTFFV